LRNDSFTNIRKWLMIDHTGTCLHYLVQHGAALPAHDRGRVQQGGGAPPDHHQGWHNPSVYIYTYKYGSTKQCFLRFQHVHNAVKTEFSAPVFIYVDCIGHEKGIRLHGEDKRSRLLTSLAQYHPQR
jgi:hypothetical protein